MVKFLSHGFILQSTDGYLIHNVKLTTAALGVLHGRCFLKGHIFNVHACMHRTKLYTNYMWNV